MFRERSTGSVLVEWWCSTAWLLSRPLGGRGEKQGGRVLGWREGWRRLKRSSCRKRVGWKDPETHGQHGGSWFCGNLSIRVATESSSPIVGLRPFTREPELAAWLYTGIPQQPFQHHSNPGVPGSLGLGCESAEGRASYDGPAMPCKAKVSRS